MMTMSSATQNVRAVLLTGLTLVACARSNQPDQGDTYHDTYRRGQQVAVLEPEDWRRAFVGSWHMSFTLTRLDGKAVSEQIAGTRHALRVMAVDSFVDRDSFVEGLRRSALPDFRSLLGRPLSCSSRDVGIVRVRRSDSSDLLVDFTPYASDCGISARLTQHADSLVGTWREHSFGNAPAEGTLVVLIVTPQP